ncbi:fibronectin type III domain-containing protein [candidate division CSSED10-310 bacterium]|uniref:Fibronectin type III domain-containing protein n=1 Tax=candidate division CSSED10-310 bacterium TaxID=2855610 RepID=A0ABV6YVC7_UNCC1
MVDLINVRNLLLGENYLGSAIPDVLGKLTNLEILELNNNHFSGNIPSTLGDLIHLRRLYLQGNQLSGPIPIQMLSLDLNPGESDFRWNAIFTQNMKLRIFLNDKQWGGDWESTQTIAPLDITTRQVSAGSIELNWAPVNYLVDAGYYEVFFSTQSGPPYNLFGQTETKTHTTVTVTGLLPNQQYFFVVHTFTLPHTNNLNVVRSEASTELFTSTAMVPTLGSLGVFIILAVLSAVLWSGTRERVEISANPGGVNGGNSFSGRA